MVKNFLFTSEMNGYRHLYLHSMDGKIKTPVTKGNYEITDVNGVERDQQENILYHGLPATHGQKFIR
jgi:dipeptidyl-peptidase-4